MTGHGGNHECARCGKQFKTEACLNEHDRGIHEANSNVCIKYVHGVENILRLGVACRSTAKRNMLAVAFDVQDVGNCSQNQNTYRNIWHRNMNERKIEKSQNIKSWIWSL